jgi:chondroitin AC lyase
MSIRLRKIEQSRANRSASLLQTIVVAACAGLLPTVTRASDLTTVGQRVTAQLLDDTPSSSTVQGYMNSLSSNGSWSDITYSSTAATDWSPLTHLQRMDSMAEAYANSGSSLYHNATLATDLSNSFNYWTATNSMSSNWFDNDIAAPQALGDVMVLISPNLTTSQINAGQTILARAKAAIPDYSGQNVVDLSIPGIDSAIVSGSVSDMASAFASIGSTIAVIPANGIQADDSYQLHGPQLYMGGYGTSYANDSLNWASIGAGTQFAITSAQEQLLVDYLLNGEQWFIRGQTLDLTADGRQVTFPSYVGAGNGYVTAIEDALALGTYRNSELETFLARQEATNATGVASSTQDTLSGNRNFFDSDAMVQQRPAYYASVKVSSTRTNQPESGNGQGLENLYLGDGVNQIMVTGNEYLGIQPSWNWRRLPGTTVEQDTRSLKPASDWGVPGTSTFAGGVSDGTYGAEAFSYNRFDVAAQKSWYFFDKEEVALGAAIKSSNTTYEVDTTINQCLLTSTVSYETTASSTIQTMTTGTVTPAGLKWVYQGGVGYFFISPASNATIQAVAQSGTWSALNTAASSSTVTQNVFTLYIDHGTAVSNGAYSYIAVPGIAASGMDAYLAANPIQVLSNTATLQAVQQTTLGMVQAVYYSAGSLNISSGQTLTSNGPSTLMLQRQTNVMKLTAANPQATQTALQAQLSGVTLSGSSSTWFDAMGTATALFNLPSGNLGGSSLGLTLTSNGAASPTVTLNNSTGSAPLLYNVTGAVALPTIATFQTDPNSTLAFSGVISGASTFVSEGNLLLTGHSTFTGGVIVASGTLQANGSSGYSGLGYGNVTVNTGATLVGGGSGSQGDPFGYNGGISSPLLINVNGGTVTNLGTASYRITLPNLTFTGGALTGAAGNVGDSSGEYSFQGPQGGPFSLTTYSASTTAIVSAATVSVENPSTFNVATGSVHSGSTPGVDLLVSSALVPYKGTVEPITKIGTGVMELTGTSTYTGATYIAAGTLTLATGGSITNSPVFNVSTGATFNVNGSIPAITSVIANGLVQFGTGSGSTIASRTVASLTIGNNGVVNLAKPLSSAGRTVMVASNFSNGGLLNLNQNDLIVGGGSAAAAAITTEIAQGYNGGAWGATHGITLSQPSVATDMTLGILLNVNASGGALMSAFDGQAVTNSSVLVKYTYYGDATLDGKVDGSDYSRIDVGYLSHATGWNNGDFNYDGVINGSDYTLIDNTFNTQGAAVTTEIATPTAEIAVPEPVMLPLLGIGVAGLLGRNHRRKNHPPPFLAASRRDEFLRK